MPGTKIDSSGVTFPDASVQAGFDATPVNGNTTKAISSDWAFDHAALITGVHGKTVVPKTANEIINNDTTLQNDNHLLFAVAANEIWEFFILVVYDSDANADIKFGFSMPAAGAMYWATSAGLAESDAGPCAVFIETSSGSAHASGVGTKDVVTIHGVYIGGANAGNVNLQWAQNAAVVADTTVYANSILVARKIA